MNTVSLFYFYVVVSLSFVHRFTLMGNTHLKLQVFLRSADALSETIKIPENNSSQVCPHHTLQVSKDFLELKSRTKYTQRHFSFPLFHPVISHKHNKRTKQIITPNSFVPFFLAKTETSQWISSSHHDNITKIVLKQNCFSFCIFKKFCVQTTALSKRSMFKQIHEKD